MNWLTKIFGGSVGSVVEQVGNVVDKFHLSGEEKQKFKLEMEALLQNRYSEIEETIRTNLQAKERILVAELTKGDNLCFVMELLLLFVSLCCFRQSYFLMVVD